MRNKNILLNKVPNKIIINISFRIVFLIVWTFIIGILTFLVLDYWYTDNIFQWMETRASLVSAMGILLGATLAALTGINAIEKNHELEEKRKEEDIYVKRLYFISTMKGISTSSKQYYELLQTYLDNSKVGKDIYLSENLKFHILEMNNTYNDYITILNNEKLPATLKDIKKDFILAIQNLIELKNDIYRIKPRLLDLSNSDKNDAAYLRFIIQSLKEISNKSNNLQKKDIKVRDVSYETIR